jgi:pimeloyl-ACP methyl ester carboxylesterase
MEEAARVESLPVPGGRVERLSLSGGPGVPLLVVGGVETGLRLLAGTEALLARRWEGRRRARPVIVVGRTIPDDPADADVLLHPRVSAAAVAVALTATGGPDVPVAIEAESGGGRISLWLTVDYPTLVARLVLAASAAETPGDSAMAPRMTEWIGLGERGEWGEFFGRMALQMRPGGETSDAPPAGSFAAAASLQPVPATPERFLAELRGTLEPSSFVTAHLGKIHVPTLVLAGGQDQVVPLPSSRLVAERIPGARLEVDPESGHTIRTSFRGYDQLVESFLAEGD